MLMLGLISFDFRVGHHRFTRQTVDIAPTQSQVCGYLLLAGLKLYFYLLYLYSSSDARLHRGNRKRGPNETMGFCKLQRLDSNLLI